VEAKLVANTSKMGKCPLMTLSVLAFSPKAISDKSRGEGRAKEKGGERFLSNSPPARFLENYNRLAANQEGENERENLEKKTTHHHNRTRDMLRQAISFLVKGKKEDSTSNLKLTGGKSGGRKKGERGRPRQKQGRHGSPFGKHVILTTLGLCAPGQRLGGSPVGKKRLQGPRRRWFTSKRSDTKRVHVSNKKKKIIKNGGKKGRTGTPRWEKINNNRREG